MSPAPEAGGGAAAASTTEASSTSPPHRNDPSASPSRTTGDAAPPQSPSPPVEPPPPPNPASDPRLSVHDNQQNALESPPAQKKPAAAASGTTSLHDLPDDIFRVPAWAAIKLLGDGIEALVRLTGDIPPSPAPEKPEVPHMRGMEAEKQNIVRSHSERTLVRLRQEAEAADRARAAAGKSSMHLTASNATAAGGMGAGGGTPGGGGGQGTIDGVRLRTPTPTTPQPHPPPSTPEPYIVVGANSQPVNVQHSAITRKFYSRKPPPINIADYLQRLHRYCPASPAVYLATSLYIHRLAVDERAIAVTRRNAHRLLLAGLRVAMKALEDRCYPHARVAQVGGVSVAELARLEISFCFLAGFELVVSPETMQRHWRVMRDSPMGVAGGGGDHAEDAAAAAGATAADATTGGDGAFELHIPRRARRETPAAAAE